MVRLRAPISRVRLLYHLTDSCACTWPVFSLSVYDHGLGPRAHSLGHRHIFDDL
eukprot:SAG31_NODE_1038_length_10218_cov_16.418223_8_plen_54_part_00